MERIYSFRCKTFVADRMGLGSTTQPDGVALHTASGGEGLGISLTCQLRQLS